MVGYIFSVFLSISSGHVVAEPVGSVRPKFPSVSNINGLTVVTNGTLPLLCPAQGFPVPSHRYDVRFRFESIDEEITRECYGLGLLYVSRVGG